jgi:hypothetical protein
MLVILSKYNQYRAEEEEEKSSYKSGDTNELYNGSEDTESLDSDESDKDSDKEAKAPVDIRIYI